MRLDKYLKVSRIIKRRTVAKEASEGGRVTLNGKVAKPSTEVKVGDVMEIRFGEKMAKFRILAVAETVRKADAGAMYELIEGEDDL
ncbi:MAG: RNA-binding S4 domain-containing protein [Clostridia bacterium]|nr:RNA-binding S4 domain-containing protein [Clostridia bacterium]